MHPETNGIIKIKQFRTKRKLEEFLLFASMPGSNIIIMYVDWIKNEVHYIETAGV